LLGRLFHVNSAREIEVGASAAGSKLLNYWPHKTTDGPLTREEEL